MNRAIPKHRFMRQEGMALATSLILLVVLAALALGGIKWAAQDISRTKDYTKSRKAVYLAEAGIHRAVSYFNYDGSGNSPGEVSNGFDDEVDGSNWPAGTFTNISLGGGTYTVTIADNNDNDGNTADDVDNTVVLTATGTADGISKTIEVVLTRTLYKGNHAIATDGDLTVSGNPSVTGSSGSAHSNADLTLSGSPSISQSATASGTYTAGGSPTVGGATASGAPVESIPVPTISDYKSLSEYVLGADGVVRDGAGTTIHNTSTDDNFRTGVGPCGSHNKGWGYDAGPPVEWDLGDSCGFPGNYYIEGNVSISGAGSAGSPFEITVIAEGHIVTSGGPELTNRKLASDPVEIQNIFMMAGTDIDMGGNPTNAIEGMIYAGEQIEFSGNPTINGFVLAADASATDSRVTANLLSGNPNINYNGGGVAPFLSNKVTILSWQET
ncbi:MAG: hypothetical protein G3M78_03480 [Candidatus Nitrohelix vancouverensis]|uniref:Type 4 fimbrial biogenesis protein PilX N-terminal domain-containing protein n=1 Tax=Candidatus Nitrohelix vancouverensis TaxID=2705534 RepID=A0A7T0C182_9BACT|nr:MAG: hypothetical protein G3M78_03480 [Candidatus Nitrohelix vancouverensis]